jgi:hypothetical protein
MSLRRINLQPNAPSIEAINTDDIRYQKLQDKTIYYNKDGKPILEISDVNLK